MKVRFTNQRCYGLTFIELLVVVALLLVVVALLLVVVALLLPVLASAHRRSSKINCVSCLKQIGLAAHIWEGDNNNLYPMQVSATYGGAMEWVATNNVAGFFDVMSNELGTTRILICPADKQVSWPTNIYDISFGPNFCNKNISYFVGLDADEKYPQRLMFGDDNFEIGGSPVPSSVAQIFTNAPIAWAHNRHYFVKRIPYLGIPLRKDYCGNLCYADGSASEMSNDELHDALVQTDLATNRLAIP